MHFWKLNINIELKVKTQGRNRNSREKLNLRGAVSPPVAPSGVIKNSAEQQQQEAMDSFTCPDKVKWQKID